jgi:hypothetical protein
MFAFMLGDVWGLEMTKDATTKLYSTYKKNLNYTPRTVLYLIYCITSVPKYKPF